MQTKPHTMRFFKINFYVSTLHRYIRRSYLILFILLLTLFTISLSALASSYPSIGKIPEGPSGSNYAYNSFEEFKKNVNYGNKAAEEADQNFSLSSDMMGITGPFSFNFTWSDDYGLIFNTQFASMMSKKSAYALEADVGFKMNRVNLTIGHAFSPRNRIKLTVERLAQKQSFDFDSGSVEEWVSQYAGGGEFQYILGAGFLNNISFGGYYAQALSKTLDSVLYFDSDNTPWVNYRHIAGATSKGFNTALGVRPWKTATITLTGYYDWVHYRNIYDNVSVSDSNELGYGITLSQFISSSLQVTASYINRAVYRSIETGLSFCHNIFHDTRALAISLSGAKSSSDNVSSENSITLGFNYYFAPMNDTYHLPGFQAPSLKAWTSKPAVRMDQVLAAADQKSERAEVSSLVSDVFTYAEVETTGTIAEKISWNDITTNVPNGELEYYLTLKDTTASSNGLLKTDASSLPDNQLVNGNTFTVDGLSPELVYSVQLRAVEKNSGASQTYTDSFTAGVDKIKWPPDLGLKVVSMRSKDGLLTATVTFNLATSSISSPMSYYVTVTSKVDDKFKEFDTTVDDETVKNGIDVPGLHPNTDEYTVTVKPTDDYGTTVDAKTATFKTSPGEITWSNKDQDVDVTASATTATVSFAKATPSIEDTIVTYSINGTNQKDSSDAFSKTITSSDCTGTTCSAGITGLSPVSTYSIKVTVSDDWDNSVSSADGQTFTTAQGDMTWSNAGKELSNITKTTSAITLKWSQAAPSDGQSVITYSIYKSKDDDDVVGIVKSTDCSGEGETACQYTISGLSPGTAYNNIYVTASDDVDGTLSTSPQTISTAKGTMTWGATGVTFDSDNSQLKWDAATSKNSNNITYAIRVTSDAAGNTNVIDKTASDDGGTSNHYTVTANLTKNTTYYAWITASDPVDNDITKGGADFDFLMPGGKLDFPSIDATIADPYKTISWKKATSSSGNVDVTYDLTITANAGNQTLPNGEAIVANTGSSDPSKTLDDDQYFLPGVTYTIKITAHDDFDTNTETPKSVPKTPSYDVTWTWNSSATISSTPNQWKTAKQYSITIDKPDVTVSPVIGIIKNSYAIYESSNTNTSISSGDTLVKSETLYTDQVKPSVNDIPMNKYYKVKLKTFIDGFQNSDNNELVQTKVIAK